MGLWGFNFVALKLLYREMTPEAVAFVRGILMYAALLGLCWAMRVPIAVPRSIRKRVYGLGFLAMGFYLVLFLKGMQGSSAAEGAIIIATGPVLTLVFATIAGQERFNPKTLVGLLVALSGVALVVSFGDLSAPGKIEANLLILLSAAVWAASAVYSKPLMQMGNPLTITTASMPAAFLALVPYGLKATLEVDWAGLTPWGWFFLVYVSVAAGSIGFALFYLGVRQVGAAGAMTYQYLVPVIATLSAWLVFGRVPHAMQFAGFGVVVLGVVLAVRAQNRVSASPKVELEVPLTP